jgi:hypothetical protein
MHIEPRIVSIRNSIKLDPSDVVGVPGKPQTSPASVCAHFAPVVIKGHARYEIRLHPCHRFFGASTTVSRRQPGSFPACTQRNQF